MVCGADGQLSWSPPIAQSWPECQCVHDLSRTKCARRASYTSQYQSG